jgi:hypothetical protein
MQGGADVKSLEGLIDWHAALATFRHECLECIASLNLEIQRAGNYLEDQLQFWRNAVRDCEEEVVQCKYALKRKQMPDFSGRMPDTSVEEQNLGRAEQRREYAQDQVEIVRRWMVNLPREINEVYEGIARRYTNFIEGDTQRALNALEQQIKSLEAYFNLQAESMAPPPPSSQEPIDPV